MLDYLEKFNNLPDEVKEKISTPDVIKKLEEIEGKFDINLATLVIRVVVGDIQIDKLVDYLIDNYHLNQLVAEGLVEDMRTNIFSNISGHLEPGTAEDKKADISRIWMEDRKKSTKPDTPAFYFSPQDEEEIKGIKRDHPAGSDVRSAHDGVGEQIDTIVASVSLHFTSQELLERFRNILKIYLIGVRRKIDTRQTFMKEIEKGGLGLDAGMVDKIFAEADYFIARKENKEVSRPRQFKTAEDQVMTRQDVYSGENEEASVVPVDAKRVKREDVPYDFSRFTGNPRPEKKEKKTETSTASLEFEVEPPVPTTAPTSKTEEKKGLEEPPKVKKTEAGIGSPPGQAKAKKQSIEEVLESIDKTKETEETSSSQPKESSFPPALDLREVSRIQTAQKEAIHPTPEPMEKEVSAVNQEIQEEAAGEKEDNVDLVFSRAVVEDIDKLNSLKRQEIKRPARRRLNGKVNMDDIVYEPKLIGPVEELGTMNLINFRRLSENSGEAVEKILEKLDILEEENYKKRLEGIAAWRQSPVNQLYLTIGQESIEAGGIKDAVKKRQTEGEENLSPGEFEAIMDLNKRLRF